MPHRSAKRMKACWCFGRDFSRPNSTNIASSPAGLNREEEAPVDIGIRQPHRIASKLQGSFVLCPSETESLAKDEQPKGGMF
jgi:hypothetical protein